MFRFPRFVALSVASLAFSFALPALAQSRPADAHPDAPPAAKDIPIPQETKSVTQHQMTVSGQTLHYTATAGNLLISRMAHDEVEEPCHSMFYVAYTLDGADA